MSSVLGKFKKIFKRAKHKDVKTSNVECDSIPAATHQEHLPIPIPQETLLNASNSFSRNGTSHLTTNSSSIEVYGNHNHSLTSNSYHSASSPNNSGYSSPVPYIQLSVNNSHGFHIGDVQNVHVSNGSVVNFNNSTTSPGFGLASVETSLSALKNSSSNHSHYDALIKDYSKIKDWEVNSISECIEKDWKALGQHLELNNSDLLAIEQNNSNSPKAAALEMLNLYLKTFPDTSYGFILNSLRETGQTKAFEQLLKLRS